jgi:hypothetical protein
LNLARERFAVYNISVAGHKIKNQTEFHLYSFSSKCLKVQDSFYERTVFKISKIKPFLN